MESSLLRQTTKGGHMERSVGALVLNWNQSHLIEPHINMLKKQVDHIKFLQTNRPLKVYEREHGYSKVEDNSIEVVNKLFPEIEVHRIKVEDDDESMMFSSLWNQGLELMKDYDMVLKLDLDQFFTDEDFEKFINIIRKSDHKNIALDWSRNSINYYLDLDHGLMDQSEKDPLAVDPNYAFGPLLQYPHDKAIWNTDVIMHHLRNFKPWVTQDWVDGIEPSPYGIYSLDLLKRYGYNGDWFTAPKEIKNKFNGWKSA